MCVCPSYARGARFMCGPVLMLARLRERVVRSTKGVDERTGENGGGGVSSDAAVVSTRAVFF